MVAILIILMPAPAVALDTSFPLSPGDDAISDALDFLRDAQNTDGSIGGFGVSAWAVMAIAAAGEDPHEWGSPSIIDYLKANSDQLDWSKATDLERSILAICAAGETPTNFGGEDYVAQLKTLYDGEQIGYDDTLNDDFWGVLALIAAGESSSSEIIQNTCDFIIDNQNESDGGWSWELYGDSDVDNTAAAIMALAAADALDEDIFFMASFFLLYNQNSDGGFPYQVGGVSNSSSDSWTIGALVAAGEDPTSSDWEWDDNPVGHLLSLQNGDGSFGWTADSSDNPEWMTAYAITALLGDPYPVTPIEWEPPLSDGPDLAVTDVDMPATIYTDVTTTVTATIANIGDEDINDSFTVRLKVDGTTVDSTNVNGLAVDDSVDVDLSWIPDAAGGYTLEITADSAAIIDEADEDNNEYDIYVEVIESAEGTDLIVADIGAPATIYSDVTTTITATITNTGDEDTDDSFTVRLKADGATVDTATVTALNAGDSVHIDFDWLPTAIGEYVLGVTTDSGDDIEESNEDNNEGSIEVEVTEQPDGPDLAVTDVDMPATIYTDVATIVTATIANIGDEDISGSFEVRLKVDGTTVDSANVNGLAADDSVDVDLSWVPTTAGSYTIRVTADSGDAINELDETNNDSSLEAAVATAEGDSSQEESSTAATPAVSVSLEPANIDFGELVPGETSAEFAITITNNGNRDVLVTADLAGNAQDFYTATLRLDDQPWDAFEIMVPQNSSVVIGASLSVPQSYSGQILEGGILIFWVTAAS